MEKGQTLKKNDSYSYRKGRIRCTVFVLVDSTTEEIRKERGWQTLVGDLCREAVSGPEHGEEETAVGACFGERPVISQHLALD